MSLKTPSRLNNNQLEEWGKIRNSDNLVNPKTKLSIQRGKATFLAIEEQYAKYLQKKSVHIAEEAKADEAKPLLEDALTRAMQHMSLRGDNMGAAKLGSLNRSLFTEMRGMDLRDNRSLVHSKDTDMVYDILKSNLTVNKEIIRYLAHTNAKLVIPKATASKIVYDLDKCLQELRTVMVGPGTKRMTLKRPRPETHEVFMIKLRKFHAFDPDGFEPWKRFNGTLYTATLFLYKALQAAPEQTRQAILRSPLFLRIKDRFDIPENMLASYGCFVHAYLLTVGKTAAHSAMDEQQGAPVVHVRPRYVIGKDQSNEAYSHQWWILDDNGWSMLPPKRRSKSSSSSTSS